MRNFRSGGEGGYLFFWTKYVIFFIKSVTKRVKRNNFEINLHQKKGGGGQEEGYSGNLCKICKVFLWFS